MALDRRAEADEGATVRLMLSISPDLGVSRLHAVDYAHRRHDDHSERDDRAEQEHHDRRTPGALDQFLDQALARLTAEDTDRTEPTCRK